MLNALLSHFRFNIRKLVRFASEKYFIFILAVANTLKMSKTLILNDKKGELVCQLEKLSSDFANLYCSSDYSDVLFEVENEKIPCKYAILILGLNSNHTQRGLMF